MSFNKRAQVAIYVIVAIVLVAGILLFVFFRDQIGGEDVPAEFRPVFDYYLRCIEDEARVAIEIAGAQGGYVKVPDYAPGSEFAPFSSHLNFLGFPVPYWYYISGNGLIKEQIPTKSEMEREIGSYIEERLEECDFRNFFVEEFEIRASEPIVSVEVLKDKVEVGVNSNLVVSRGENSGSRNTHSIIIDSKLGNFYDNAVRIYNKQKEEAFLEDYAVDVLRLYAPVDGVEVQCGPKVWSTLAVQSDLKDGLSANIGSIKFEGTYYDIQDERREYFVVEESVDERVNLIYSRNWPTKIEIHGEGVDNEIIIAEPVGTQEGLGAMGFCYVPYHFVYDMSFPVLIQLYDSEELFQFPVVVIVDNNVPRKADLSGTSIFEEEDVDLCAFYTQDVEVNVYNINLNKIDANISFECFDQKCNLGESVNGKFVGKAPGCYNGYLHLRAGGYADKKQLFSTNEDKSADVILEREYEIELELEIDGQSAEGKRAVVSFTREDGKVVSAALPEVKRVKLSEGSYEISAYVYGDSSLVIPASTKVQCAEVPKKGLLGFFGGKEERCFNINIPETKMEFGLVGGGKGSDYFLESGLEKRRAVIKVQSLPKPNSLEDLQRNFETFETRRVRIEFKDG
jgi:hypothetical protein